MNTMKKRMGSILATVVVFTLGFAWATNVNARTVSSTAQVTVKVEQPIAIALTASPTSINTGDTSTLTWTVTDTSSPPAPLTCTASGGWSGAVSATGGTQTVSPTADTTYVLTCADSVQSQVAQATVTVVARPIDVYTAFIDAANGWDCETRTNGKITFSNAGGVSFWFPLGNTPGGGPYNCRITSTPVYSNCTLTQDTGNVSCQITGSAGTTWSLYNAGAWKGVGYCEMTCQ